MIDWSKLKPYQNNKYRSFEELCYQIAKGLYGEKGRFTSIDDSGGGDGVEFYLTLPNGDQWGWQAKFYHPQERLSESGRKRSITNSVKTACEIHPHLKKWILCTPTNFTPDEQKWFDNTLRQSISEDIEIEHWEDRDFNNWLSEQRFSGKLHYFFGELELELDWFKRQFDKQMAGVGDKFDSSLHTETNVDAEIHALLGDEAFSHQITKWIEELEGELPDLKEAIDELKRPIPYIEWDEEENSKVIGAYESLQDGLVNIIDKFKQARNILDKQELTAAQAIDWGAVHGQFYKVFDNCRAVTRESGIPKMRCTVEKKYEEQVLHKASSVVHGPDHLVATLLDKFFPTVIWQLGLINKSDLHILGDAGIGKTHIACNICDDRLSNGLPALFVRGSQFRTDQIIEVQLRDIFDIPLARSWHDFLQALSAAAEAYHTRIPLIIDGLNESVHNGTFSNIWELGLKGLVQEIAQTKNLVLITTCRRSYEEAIWKEGTPKEFNWEKFVWEDKDSPNLVYAYGFDTDEVKQEAIDKYFNAYKIKADLTLAPLRQFEHPLHLNIFCETKNRESKTEVQVYVGEQTLFEVFDEYLEQCNEEVCKRLELRPGTSVIQPALNKIAKYLWRHRTRNINIEEMACIVDGQYLEEPKWWESSKTRAIEAEGLLVCRDWIGGKDTMSFTYELLGGYLIALHLVQQAAKRRQSYLRRTVSDLFGKESRNSHPLLSNIRKCLVVLFPAKIRRFLSSLLGPKTAHPMSEDIGRCLAALLPTKISQFLHELSDNREAFGLSIRALFEISPGDINQDSIDLVTHLFGVPENRESFFKLAETTVGHPNHPFNASFWSDQLLPLSMSERDLSWTEYVRRNRYRFFEEMVIRFEETCRDAQNISDYGKKRLLLLAEYIMWILTSTVRPLRDQATRALYWYGRRFPKEFFDLVMKSFTINDPYVSERMLAATYGIAMARQNDFEDTSFVTEMLPLYAKELYDTMFNPNAPHATTHISARDYAKRTIDIALIHRPDLLTEDERERINPPFTDGGTQEWGESENREEGSPPVQMDFENYTLRGLLNYDSNADESERVKANVYWRIYDLGFSLEDFGEIDKRISGENWSLGRYNEHSRKIDRYGKKYSWIAFYELAGFREDKGILPDYNDNSRCIEADIDPSFPDEHREYNLVTENFLGDHGISTEQWVYKTPHPNLTLYLNRERLCEEQGPWVILRGYLSQEDKQVNRSMFAWLQGLIVKSEKVEEIVKILNRQENIDGHTVPFIPEDYRTYAGEIPWCDTYPPNNWQEFPFLVRKYKIPKKQFELLRGGEPIYLIDDFELWDTTRKLIEKGDEKRLNELLRERNLEIRIKTVDEEKLEHKDFEVLVPVRDNSWEESCSAANPHRSIAIPAREIADSLDLYGHPQSFDLFEKINGKRASISFRDGEIWGNVQHFTYLRQDLLEHYLAEIDGELIWVIWGNRHLVSQNPDDPYENFQYVKAYRDMQKTSGGS